MAKIVPPWRVFYSELLTHYLSDKVDLLTTLNCLRAWVVKFSTNCVWDSTIQVSTSHACWDVSLCSNLFWLLSLDYWALVLIDWEACKGKALRKKYNITYVSVAVSLLAWENIRRTKLTKNSMLTLSNRDARRRFSIHSFMRCQGSKQSFPGCDFWGLAHLSLLVFWRLKWYSQAILAYFRFWGLFVCICFSRGSNKYFSFRFLGAC